MRLADRHLISDKTGVIKNIWTSRVAPNDPDLFVCSVETPNISHYTRRPFLGDCGGAGLTKMDAKAAAIGETVERYCASIYYDRDLTLGTYREVRTDREAVSPTELPVFHERQYEYLDYTRFTEDTKIGWVEAWSLS
ncbi:MAG: YcaO-like family protein, partial [Salinibacter sp.]